MDGKTTLYFEVIDPKTLEPVGKMAIPGELVITTLTKEALPMVRYRTRDITGWSGAPCDCGRTHVAYRARHRPRATTC